MAAIWTRRIQFVAAIGELVGYKSGLALTRQELCDSAPDDYRGIWSGDEDDVLRIRVEVYEEVLAWILFRLGNIPSPSLVPPPTRVILGCKDDPERYRMALDIGQLMPGFLESGLRQAEEQQSRLIDPTPLLEEVYKRHGTTGVRIAGQFLEEINLSLHRSASGVCRQVEWKDTKELDGLFHSESLDTYYGTFLDQRFIDYLGANFDDIDSMNWRKFEGLACEFFQRVGCHVEIGEGRNDEGIDGRVWPSKEDRSQPPLVLVQCKRQQDKVSKVVVKALYADVVAEGAKAGIIVTTNALSPGARRVCTARSYPVGEADRETLRKWLAAMRTPGTGVFCGE